MQLCWYRGHWYAREGRKRYSLRTKDRDEALRRLKDVERERIAIGRGQAGTVADILDAYVEERKDRASIAKIQDACKALKPLLGHLRPDQVDRAVCRDYRRRRKASDGTKRKELGVLQAALRLAGIPARLELPPMPPPRDVFITKAEFERLVANAEAPHIKLFLEVSWHTAARKEAVLSLRWDDCDLQGRRINFGRGRGNKGRAIVPIGGILLKRLSDAKRSAVSDYVVEWGGQRCGSIRKGFESAASRAELSNITPHDLRRSAARVMVEAGVPLEAVAQYLGHSNVAVTYSTYARFAPNSKVFLKAARSLE